MSLLHEAIRKAERAHEEAQRPPRRAELSSVPLEIVAESDAPAAPQSLALEPQIESGPSRETCAPSQTLQPDAEAPTPSEFSAPNPRLAFYASLVAAGIAAIATAAYFWMQLRPASAIVKPNSPRAVTAAPATPPPAAEPSRPSSNSSVPGLPSVPAEPAQAQSAAPLPPVPAAQPTRERAVPEARKARSENATSEDFPPQPPPRSSPVARAAPQVHPRVQSGYAAYQAGDLALARSEYQDALRDDSANRDALLGLAAVESRSGRAGEAETYYRRLLQADPRDPHAHAGLLALRSQRVDPLQAESRIKTLLANDPEASVLHFSLGNQYARQGRWDEAQLAYAKAHAAAPGNPDFAFNRAVSLDHLRQRAAALEHYRLALELAATRPANFSLQSAAERVRELSR